MQVESKADISSLITLPPYAYCGTVSHSHLELEDLASLCLPYEDYRQTTIPISINDAPF